MLKRIYIILLLFCVFPNCIFSNNQSEAEPKSKIKKTGWTFMPLPMFSYTSGVGLSLGLNMQLYNYGDGAKYPNVYNLILIQGEYNTSKAGNGRVFFYSSKFLKHFEFVGDLGYFYETNAQFRGFNGFMAKLGNESQYYTMTRGMFAGYVELYKPIYKNLKVAAGIEMFSINLKPKEEKTLFEDYVSEGIINENEINGGNNMFFKVGLIYDSRDVKKMPSKGIYSLVSLMYSPDFFDKRNLSHLLLIVQHNQYINLWKNRLQFAYRLSYQGVIAGNSPFYLLSRMHSFDQARPNVEGVGGAFTVRGLDLVRLVGNDVFYANFELRATCFKFRVWIWNVELALNPFFDMGMVARQYNKNQMQNAFLNGRTDIISGDKETLHCSYGIGGKIILNKTTILSGEIGFPTNKRDGKFGMFFGVDFLF